MKGAFLVRGDARIAVDLSEARIAAKDPKTMTATIVLPPPEVESARVDHERSSIYDVRKGLLVLGDKRKNLMIDDAWRHAERPVASVAGKDEWIERARRQAEIALREFYGVLDWQVRVEWQDRPAKDAKDDTEKPAPPSEPDAP